MKHKHLSTIWRAVALLLALVFATSCLGLTSAKYVSRWAGTHNFWVSWSQPRHEKTAGWSTDVPGYYAFTICGGGGQHGSTNTGVGSASDGGAGGRVKGVVYVAPGQTLTFTPGMSNRTGSGVDYPTGGSGSGNGGGTSSLQITGTARSTSDSLSPPPPAGHALPVGYAGGWVAIAAGGGGGADDGGGDGNGGKGGGGFGSGNGGNMAPCSWGNFSGDTSSYGANTYNVRVLNGQDGGRGFPACTGRGAAGTGGTVTGAYTASGGPSRSGAGGGGFRSGGYGGSHNWGVNGLMESNGGGGGGSSMINMGLTVNMDPDNLGINGWQNANASGGYATTQGQNGKGQFFYLGPARPNFVPGWQYYSF